MRFSQKIFPWLMITFLLLIQNISFADSDSEIISFEEFMAVDDHIRTEIRDHVGFTRSPQHRLLAVIDYIFDEDGIDYTYDKYKNLTARETFYQKTGNCLSFACLMVALGREVGLNIHFNNMKKPLTLRVDGDLLLDIKHINAVMIASGDYQVIELNKYYREFMFDQVDIITDKEAYLFYLNNMGVFSIRDGDMDLGFKYFDSARMRDKKHSSTWKNLGSYYSRINETKKAENCYLAAYRLNKRDPVTCFFLGKLYEQRGLTAKSEKYMKRGRLYMSRNPYNFFVMGNNALAAGKPEEAIKNYRRAIKIDDNCHVFYYHMALAYGTLEDYTKMRDALELAYEHSNQFADRLQYSLLLDKVDHEGEIYSLQQQTSNN